MAVMATQQSDGALLSEKPLHTTLGLEKDARNGSADVNGHASSEKTLELPEAEVAAKESNKPTPTTANAKLDKNQDAFSTNSSVKANVSKAVDELADLPIEHNEMASGTELAKVDDATSADTEMVDAPVSLAIEEKADSPDVSKPQAALQAEAQSEVQSDPLPELVPETQPETKIEVEAEQITKEDSVLSSAAVSPTTKPAADTLPVDEKEDIVMADILEAVENAESTQETQLSDVPPVSPAADGDAAELPTLPAKSADAAQGTPPPINTADTSMSEPAQSAKVSRERDIDSEDEPVAKRTKVDHSADIKKEQNSMDGDKKSGSGSASLYQSNGQPKRLDDPSLDQTPVTDWQNKQIRTVLAGVKKTKVGSNFRQPVGTLWPDLWSSYSLRVTNPIDISTMEKKFRGELNGYSTLGDFKRDLQLLVDNSIAFNGENHDVTRAAQACREAILSRMNAVSAVEPARPDKKDTIKQHPTRHTEPRPASHQPPASVPSRPPKPAAASPPPKPPVENPAFAIPPGNNGVPLIRRDSTKTDSRTKRPVKVPPSKDLIYDQKRKKKLPPELRFCEDVLMELRKSKHFEFNGPFMLPVDPVALNIPHYHKIIKKPMDLSTMSTKLQTGEYMSAKEFERDFDLIIKNCKAFNGEDHIVYTQALRLQSLFNSEMGRKSDWLSKNAPVAPVHQASPRIKDESEDEEEEDITDPNDDERKAIEAKIATLQKRVVEEQKKIDDLVNNGSGDVDVFDTSSLIVNTLQKSLMQERQKLAALPARAVVSKPAKSAKPHKKPSASHVGASAKKATTTGHSAGGAVKKAAHKKPLPKRRLTEAERAVITEFLGELDGAPLEKAIDLIKKDTGQGENESGELELDIESLSEDALVRLYDLIVKHHPQARKKEKTYMPTPTEPPAKNNKANNATKSKKNKPMSKIEQERRIQQLNALRAQATRNASGSQEPMESIEGPGGAAAEPTRRQDHDSDDEDSEED